MIPGRILPREEGELPPPHLGIGRLRIAGPGVLDIGLLEPLAVAGKLTRHHPDGVTRHPDQPLDENGIFDG
ncbi:hypothetical protein D3C83_108320 [compost metagenome]